ncbi:MULTISPECIES: phage shock protein PspA [Alteromonadaceae]|uniref:phage shock protein PspA n=1 Tax=Alteromonadaceae TaxID=72275 RepID=UPI001C09C6A7|nr:MULTISPECIES: phage shock protein PspA [Aliiglaciecola]MBU2878627.1 phage shock protein PspA [Aliiglaciecola lipolytica]MDO6709544.1 phage shock protein PspA [Aliiglaciecola sp. 2_MG-2023]MDO6750914.1 phage shock protein PspA [Aliiglaciecola sp. 1_MG-2023]
MGMFTRMSDIVQANLNAILDKAEDPQKVIRLIVQEMEETLVEIRSVAARSLADKKHLVRKQEKLEGQVKDWQSKATVALKKEREDLARAALVEKNKAQESLKLLTKEMDVVEEAIAKLQDDTSRLQEKLKEARSRQKALDIRQQSVSVRLKAKTSQSVEKIDDAIARFEHYESRIDDLESQVEAYDLVSESQSLSAQIEKLEQDENIEKELAALRKKVA